MKWIVVLVCFAHLGPRWTAVAQSAGTFVATGSMTTARSLHTATRLADGKVLITGGYNGLLGEANGVPFARAVSSAELYDPFTGRFTATSEMNSPRAGHTATRLKNGQVLIAGGSAYGTAELYDPSKGTFQNTGDLNAPQVFHSATLLRSGKVLIVGGWIDASQGLPAELYDPDTGTFTPLDGGGLSGGGWWSGSRAVRLKDGRVLIAGGLSNLASSLYNPDSGTFKLSSDTTFPWGGLYGIGVSFHTATLIANGKVLVVGGGEDVYATIIVPNAELYNPLTERYTATGFPMQPRMAHSATALLHGRVLVTGGCCIPSAGRSGEVYDSSTERFTPAGNMNVARAWHTSTLLADGTVLIAGGGYTGDATFASAAGTASAERYIPPFEP